MITGYKNEISYLVGKSLVWAPQRFEAADIKILKVRSLEVVAVCGMMNRSQEDASFLSCAFSNIPWVCPLWTSLRHRLSTITTILRDSHLGASLTWRIRRQQTPINEKSLSVSTAQRYILKRPEVMVFERRKPVLPASWAQGQCVKNMLPPSSRSQRWNTQRCRSVFNNPPEQWRFSP